MELPWADSLDAHSGDKEKARKNRESSWTASRNAGDQLVREYVEYAFVSNVQWLDRLRERLHLVMETNADLQEQLKEQDGIVRELRSEEQAREKHWKAVEKELADRKVEQQNIEKQYRQIRAQRISDEKGLWNRGVLLHQKLASLNMERARLEEHRRDEDRQMAKLQESSTRLQQEMIALQLRKNELEEPSESDVASLGLTSYVERFQSFTVTQFHGQRVIDDQGILDSRSRNAGATKVRSPGRTAGTAQGQGSSPRGEMHEALEMMAKPPTRARNGPRRPGPSSGPARGKT